MSKCGWEESLAGYAEAVRIEGVRNQVMADMAAQDDMLRAWGKHPDQLLEAAHNRVRWLEGGVNRANETIAKLDHIVITERKQHAQTQKLLTEAQEALRHKEGLIQQSVAFGLKLESDNKDFVRKNLELVHLIEDLHAAIQTLQTQLSATTDLANKNYAAWEAQKALTEAETERANKNYAAWESQKKRGDDEAERAGKNYAAWEFQKKRADEEKARAYALLAQGAAPPQPETASAGQTPRQPTLKLSPAEETTDYLMSPQYAEDVAAADAAAS
jgi:hypothetical protein